MRVRFAPSPTGALHIGGVRTALYNYLLARQQGGTFVLRIEDTDQGRYVEGAEAYIMEALAWLGIEPDESPSKPNAQYAPYRQSERKPLYGQYAERLIAEGKAYYAFDTAAELEAARAADPHFKYDARSRGRLRNALSLPADETRRLVQAGEYVVRLRVEPDRQIAFEDAVRGRVEYSSNDLDDKVLLKSDGMPTYHLANVVDDYLMEITQVIRGEEWLPSTPTHVLLYEALGWTERMPRFAHLPLILRPDGKGKLSKRDGAKFGIPVFPLDWQSGAPGTDPILGFREWGFEPAAVLNFLALLGWSPGDDVELMPLDELVRRFDLAKVQKAGARFDFDKARWFNKEYLQHLPEAEWAERLLPLLQAQGYAVEREYVQRVCALLRPRLHFWKEVQTEGKCFFEMPDYEAVKTREAKNIEKKILKTWDAPRQDAYRSLAPRLSDLPDFEAAAIDAFFNEALETETGLPKGEVFPFLRLALAGSLQGPGLAEMMETLGRKTVLMRINAFLKVLERIKELQ